jgi:hypothetical protein
MAAMSGEGELAAWLRLVLVLERDRWCGLEAAYAPNVEREGEVLWRQAQEQADRCKAELAILEQHRPEFIDYRDGDGIERSSRECIECEPSGTPDNWPCPTVRLLASGYKHRPGYREEWKP